MTDTLSEQVERDERQDQQNRRSEDYAQRFHTRRLKRHDTAVAAPLLPDGLRQRCVHRIHTFNQCAAAVRALPPTTNHRAVTLNNSDISSRISATSAKADRWSAVLASANSLANKLDIVCAGAKIDALIRLLLPMTIVIAIVSPAARARPSMTAPNNADREKSNISFELCHHVAPSASVPSICARGTDFKTSRLIAVMIGKIMIARTSPPQNISRPVSGSVRTSVCPPAVAVSENSHVSTPGIQLSPL